MTGSTRDPRFGEDLEFLQRHVDVVTLRNAEDAAVLVVPAYQGRTMTSTATGDRGNSYGYLNYAAIASDRRDPQINLYGGEDRMWISPEGGQYSVFFEPGAEMTFANWRTPAALDTEPFDVLRQDSQSITLGRQARLTNWTGTRFDVQLQRQVRLLDRATAAADLGVDLSDVEVCVHESLNTVTNEGDHPWEPETGLIGIWMLCMSKPSPQATLIIPFACGAEESLETTADAAIVNADYFGPLDETRLKIDRQRKLIYFLGDGQHRSKLGLTFERVRPRLASWDGQRGILSVVEFNLPAQAPHGYNNNLWEYQDQPYAGDVINCYNDGLNESGSQLGEGGFYELETVSPALALAPGESFEHRHRTHRMEGPREALDVIAQSVLGVDLASIESQFRGGSGP